MAEHRWSVLCRRGIIDKNSNLLSVIEVMDELTMEEDPPQPLPENIGLTVDGWLVSLWARSEPDKSEQFWQTVTMTGPGGEATDKVGIKLQGKLHNHPRVRLLVQIKAIRYFGPGVYTFNIYYSKSEKNRGKLVHTLPLEIKTKKETTSSTSPEQPGEQS